jgi:hypothetical protein
MEKVRVKLRDTKTQFYDITQGAGLVSVQVKELYKTQKVATLIKAGFLQLTEDDLNPAPAANVEPVAEVKPVEPPVEPPVEDLASKTIDQLKAILTEKGIEFPASAKKADLLALLGA